MQVIGIMLVRNEDQFIGQALMNVLDFCDKIIIADHLSEDNTPEVVRRIRAISDKVTYIRISKSGESHELIKMYAGTQTWLFGVDGDEIYDPVGLAKLRLRMEAGAFDETWQVFGNVLHCISIDTEQQVATGFLAPPSRPMTKLYNFNAIQSWGGECNEPFLGGQIIFREGFNERLRMPLHMTMDWEQSDFRCLHACFIRRSSLDRKTHSGINLRPNPVEISNRSPRHYLLMLFPWLLGRGFVSKWKRDKYMKGPKVTKDIRLFLERQVPK